MGIKAALLDERGVYVRMDELPDESALTGRHVASITECDLPPGKYKWLPDEKNEYGGAFWPIEWLKRVGVEV